MVVVVVGNVDYDGLVVLVCEYFGFWLVWGRWLVVLCKGIGWVNGSFWLILVSCDVEQMYVLLGICIFGCGWEYCWVLLVLYIVLGGGLSFWLFQEVCEICGLVYLVYFVLDFFVDSGVFLVYVVCLFECFVDVMWVIVDVLESVVCDGIIEVECGIVKGLLWGGLVLGLEDFSFWMSWFGCSELNYGKYCSIEYILW